MRRWFFGDGSELLFWAYSWDLGSVPYEGNTLRYGTCISTLDNLIDSSIRHLGRIYVAEVSSSSGLNATTQ